MKIENKTIRFIFHVYLLPLYDLTTKSVVMIIINTSLSKCAENFIKM